MVTQEVQDLLNLAMKMIKFSNYLSNLWTNISGIKQVVY